MGERKAIASADAIMSYLQETVAENGIRRAIRFRHKVIEAAWSTEDARWLVEIERPDTGERVTMSCGWFFCASGYYRYDEGSRRNSRAGNGLPGRSCTRSTGPKTWTTAASGW